MLKAVSDQLELGEAVERESIRLDRGVTGEEMTQIVAVSAQRRRREVLACQAVEERRHPGWFASPTDGVDGPNGISVPQYGS